MPRSHYFGLGQHSSERSWEVSSSQYPYRSICKGLISPIPVQSARVLRLAAHGAARNQDAVGGGGDRGSEREGEECGIEGKECGVGGKDFDVHIREDGEDFREVGE